jgi:hypothetical protein
MVSPSIEREFEICRPDPSTASKRALHMPYHFRSLFWLRAFFRLERVNRLIHRVRNLELLRAVTFCYCPEVVTQRFENRVGPLLASCIIAANVGGQD